MAMVATTAMALSDEHGIDLPFAFNRKEAKTHGEGGSIVGAPLAGDVCVVFSLTREGEFLKIIRISDAL